MPDPQPSDIALSNIGLPMRIFNALIANDIVTVAELRDLDYRILMSFRHVGSTSVHDVHRALGRTGDAMQFNRVNQVSKQEFILRQFTRHSSKAADLALAALAALTGNNDAK